MPDEIETPAKRRRGRPRGTTKAAMAARRQKVPASGSAMAGYTAELRERLGAMVSKCPCCGQATGNKSQLARDLGLSTMSLNKILNGGRVNSDTVDKVHAYLSRQ